MRSRFTSLLQKFESEYLAVDSHEELEHWKRQLDAVTRKRNKNAPRIQLHSESSSGKLPCDI